MPSSEPLIMHLTQFKHRQALVLSERGGVLSVEGHLLSEIGQHTTLSSFPLIESIFPSLLQLPDEAFPFEIKNVLGCGEHLPGFYDFIFLRIQGGFIEWQIIDRSDQYEKIQEERQLEHEDYLKQESRRIIS